MKLFILSCLLFASALAQTVSKDEDDLYKAIVRMRATGYTCPGGKEFEPSAKSLFLDCRLYKSAKKHSDSMATYGYVSHLGVEGDTYIDRGEAEGIFPSLELIQSGSDNADDALFNWKDNEDSCNDLMMSQATSFAVAKSTNMESAFKHYWTLVMSLDEFDGDSSCHYSDMGDSDSDIMRTPQPIINFRPHIQTIQPYIQPTQILIVPAEDLETSDRPHRHTPIDDTMFDPAMGCHAHEEAFDCHGRSMKWDDMSDIRDGDVPEVCVWHPHAKRCVDVEMDDFDSAIIDHKCHGREPEECYGFASAYGDTICAWNPFCETCKPLLLENVELDIDVMCHTHIEQSSCNAWRYQCYYTETHGCIDSLTMTAILEKTRAEQQANEEQMNKAQFDSKYFYFGALAFVGGFIPAFLVSKKIYA